MAIYFWSDLHFGHDKPFIYENRGYTSIQEHDEEIFRKIINTVSADDTLYLLGDCLMGDNSGIDYLCGIPCKVIIILGNHDTENRIGLYECYGFEYKFADRIKYKKGHFFLSHYPIMLENYDDENKPFHVRSWCLCGHTHTQNQFEHIDHRCYHVDVDAHPDGPVSIEEIRDELRAYCIENSAFYKDKV